MQFTQNHVLPNGVNVTVLHQQDSSVQATFRPASLANASDFVVTAVMATSFARGWISALQTVRRRVCRN